MNNSHQCFLGIRFFIALSFVIALSAPTHLHAAKWVQQNSGTDHDLRSVYFTHIKNGWIVGDYGTILHTTDGGSSWYPQDIGSTDHLSKVHFLNKWYGFAVSCPSKKLYKTTD